MAAPEITVRDAGSGDAGAIARLVREHGARGIDERVVARHLSSPSSRLLVAEVGDAIAGLLGYSVRPDLFHAGPVCLIEELIVTGPWRGRGAGSALVTELLARARPLGCLEVSVAVAPGDARAVEFYRAQGLVEEAVLLEKHFTP
jgi:ribosomal protein S18 acetylase RimI-like enzyme